MEVGGTGKGIPSLFLRHWFPEYGRFSEVEMISRRSGIMTLCHLLMALANYLIVGVVGPREAGVSGGGEGEGGGVGERAGAEGEGCTLSVLHLPPKRYSQSLSLVPIVPLLPSCHSRSYYFCALDFRVNGIMTYKKEHKRRLIGEGLYIYIYIYIYVYIYIYIYIYADGQNKVSRISYAYKCYCCYNIQL